MKYNQRTDLATGSVVLEPAPKSPHQSKTMVFNGATILTLLATVVMLPEVASLIPAAAWPYILAFVSIVNLILRPGNQQPIALPWNNTTLTPTDDGHGV